MYRYVALPLVQKVAQVTQIEQWRNSFENFENA